MHPLLRSVLIPIQLGFYLCYLIWYFMLLIHVTFVKPNKKVCVSAMEHKKWYYEKHELNVSLTEVCSEGFPDSQGLG